MTPTTTRQLPEAFASLSEFSRWILPNEKARIEARLATPYEESVAFYQAILPELPDIMGYLKQVPVDSASEEDLALADLAYAFVEIANAVELYGEPEVPDGANLRLFVSVLDGGRA
ncbi:MULTISPECIES: hypothetical protein [unclassified Geodermatophilus]|uniref:hypothetical protein n=1 Tax=unclassified Geodermatophilus TaxID=2637632 RepID=UPI003EED9861